MISSRFYQHILLWIGMGFLLLLDRRQPFQAGLVLAETAQPAIDTYNEQQMHDLDIPGLAIAIVRGDQIAYVRGYGVADDSGRPATTYITAKVSHKLAIRGFQAIGEYLTAPCFPVEQLAQGVTVLPSPTRGSSDRFVITR